MPAISKLNLTPILAVLLATSSFVRAEDPTTLRQRLESKYPLTSINAEGGVVIQGAVLTLQKDGLTAGASSACISDYRSGQITLAHVSKTACSTVMTKFCILFPKSCPVRPTRDFVRGEKLYVITIEVGDDIVFSLVSGAINGATYKAKIRFQPGAEQADQLVAEVFSVAPPDAPPPAAAPTLAPATGPDPEKPAVPAPTASGDEPFAPILPPQAPAPTLTLGSAVDQVVAILGKPAHVIDRGPGKQIYIYNHPDLEITFVDGKVTEVM
jgi:hypothetical protein